MEALIFYGVGACFVGWILIEVCKPDKSRTQNRTAQPVPQNPAQPGQFVMNPGTEIQGAFDAPALNRAKQIMETLRAYPDEGSRTLALAHELHRDRARDVRETARQGAEIQTGLTSLKSLIETLGPLLGGRHVAPPVNNHPPQYRDDYPMRYNDGRWQ